MADPPTVSSQQATVEPGGAAVLRASGPPAVPPATPDPSRRVSPDVTGYYEAESASPVWNSNRLLHLNQAGRALVGWMTIAPGFVQPIQDFPVSFAVLVADLDPTLKTSKGVCFYYRRFETIEGIDPNLVLSPFQPWDRNDPPSLSELGTGMLAAQSASDSWDYLSQKVALTLTFTLPDGTDSPPLQFVHKAPYARVSERTIAFQDDSLKRALIARHRRPIPSSFFDTTSPCGSTWKDARSLFLDPNGPLAQQIRRYHAYEDASGPDGYTNRALALDKLGNILSFPWDGTAHAKLLDMLLTREAVGNTLTLGATTKTYRDWLSGIAANEIANQKKYGQDDAEESKDKPKDSSKKEKSARIAYPPELDKVMGGAKMYRYDFEFSDQSKDAEIIPFIKGAAGVFKVKVSALQCSVSQDGKAPKDEDFIRGEQRPCDFYGAFLELKGGNEGPPGLPEKISFYSGEPLNSVDFDGAFFELYALDASASTDFTISNPVMSPSIKLKSGGDTQLIRVHVHGVILEGTCADGQIKPKLSKTWGMHAPSWDTLKKIFSTRGIAEDSDFLSIKRPKLKVSVGASLGVGYIGYQKTFANWMRPAPPVGSGWKEGGDARTLDACFDRDSADFTKKQANNWDVRFLLETVLATDLALFNGVPNVEVEGFASPEYTPQHNLILSKKRANAVLQAIDDAVGPLSPDATWADGRGDAGALSAGLHESDPTGDVAERQTFEHDHQEEVAQWPQWRKVEINVRGHFSVHVITVDGDDA